MTFPANDDLIKRLIALGMADANGRLFAGALVDGLSTASGTVQNTEYTLNSVALPANALARAGRGLRISAHLTLAGNANAKNVKVYLGATAIATLTGSTANAKDVIIEVTVVRVSLSVQQAWAQVLVDGALVAASSIGATAAEDETTALTIAVKAANTAAAAASGTGKGLTVTQLG